MIDDDTTPAAVGPVVEAEKFILGTALTEIDHTPGADDLEPGDFYLPRHGAIWRAIQDTRAVGEPVDPVTIGERLRQAGDLQRAGGMGYLTDCTGAAMGPGTVGHHAGIVRAAARRRLREQLLTRAARLVDDEDEWDKHGPDLLAQLANPGGSRPAADRDSWQPLDLGPYLRGEVARPEPTVGVRRRDGLRFVYPGKEHSVIGEMEAGKSWFALACVAAELDQGHTVVYVHFEEADPSDTIERLQALGAHDEDIATLFRFVAPARAVTETQMARLIADPAPSLVILDGVNEGMAMHAAGIRDEDGVALFRRLLITPFIRSGCAVLTCDHVVKDRENRGRYALGSIHKGNALSGALILLENADPFGRSARGRSHIYVTKDRPGHLRRHGRGTKTSGKTFMGEMIVDDTRTHVSYLDLAILPPADPKPDEDDAERGAQLADAILDVIAALPDQHVGSERTLLAELRKAGWQVRDSVVRDAVDDLIVHRRLAETIGRRGAKGYRVLTAAQDSDSGVLP